MMKKWLIVFIFANLIFMNLPIMSALASDEIVGPVFQGIQVDKNDVTGGDKVKVSVEASDSENEIESIQVIYQYQFTQDAGSVQLEYNKSANKYEGFLDVNGRSLNLNGTWKVAYILITDKSGNELKVFNKFMYPNQLVIEDLSNADLHVSGNDLTPPTFQVITTDKKEATIGAPIKISVKASDSGSGVDYAIIRYVNVNNYEYSRDIRLDYNSSTGNYETTLNVDDIMSPGHWVVDQLYIFDKNLNGLYLSNKETQIYDSEAIDLSGGDFILNENTVPIIIGVQPDEMYNKDVTPIFNGTATLNGEPFSNGETVTKEGQYTLAVKDEEGNITQLDFTIDKTAPEVLGVASNDYYNEDVTPTFNEGTATLNGEPFSNGETISKEGQYTLVVTDKAGNVTNVNFTIDKTVPKLSVNLDVTRISKPNHKMIPIKATLNYSDSNSGIDSVVLLSIISNEPDNGLGDGNKTNDIQEAKFGTLDTSFNVRAERSGTGSGRGYTVTYIAKDKAGNKTFAKATVMVQHNARGTN
ncbi:hypothetical protein ACT8ZR_23020 [Neobacillus sp. M.A.Huq-85]|nr:hypothetical protein QNK12_04535 [Neobacillus cucumis]